MTTTKKRTTTRKINRGGDVDVFVAFQVRVRSLAFARDEVRRCKARGEEVLQVLAEMRPTGDRLADARLRGCWEEMLERAFDDYAAALDKLYWEMQEADLV